MMRGGVEVATKEARREGSCAYGEEWRRSDLRRGEGEGELGVRGGPGGRDEISTRKAKRRKGKRMDREKVVADDVGTYQSKSVAVSSVRRGGDAGSQRTPLEIKPLLRELVDGRNHDAATR